MPVRVLPPKPNLDHLKYQAKDLLKQRAARMPEAAQTIREFHPRYGQRVTLRFSARHFG
jgi:hypothetical protein